MLLDPNKTGDNQHNWIALIENPRYRKRTDPNGKAGPKTNPRRFTDATYEQVVDYCRSQGLVVQRLYVEVDYESEQT